MSSSPEDNQQKNRNFICSCGKAYLSYAALFTHIKQKHGGKAPGQIVRPRSQNKRGRPRKNDKMSTQKSSKIFGNNGILDNNNFKNNIKLANQFNLELQNSRALSRDGRGFTSYRGDNNANSRKGPAFVEKGFSTPKNEQNPIYYPTLEEQQNFELTNNNCEFSSNTLAFAQVVGGLQQLLKEAIDPQQITEVDLNKFASYSQLKKYHSQIVNAKQKETNPKQAFKLGNIICAFLNLCKQTVESKVAFQQVMLLMICLIQHMKIKMGKDVLRQLSKGCINQLLSTYFQQYQQKVIKGTQFQKYWIFQSNNAFKVIISFLDWLAVVQIGNAKREKQHNLATNDQELNQQQQNQQAQLLESQNSQGLQQQVDQNQNSDHQNYISASHCQVDNKQDGQNQNQNQQQSKQIQIEQRLSNEVK